MDKLNNININTPAYWNTVYKNEFLNNKIRIELKRFELVTNEIIDDTSVLDAGCGTGEFVNFLHKQKRNCHITGIDFSDIAINIAKKRYNSNSFLTDDITTMSNKFNNLDYVVSFEVIEHLSKPIEYIDEIYKVLKTNGILFLSTPYNNKVYGGDEHMYSFKFKDMISLLEVEKKWEPINILRYSNNLKNMLVVAKKI